MELAQTLPIDTGSPDTEFQAARILMVDDDVVNLRLLHNHLAAGGYYNLRMTDDPHNILSVFAKFQPDIILLDLHMPGKTGFEVMEELRPWIPEKAFLPIVMITGDDSGETKERALAAGAMDFLTKPFSGAEVRLRIHNLLRTRFLHLQLTEQKGALARRVKERTHELELARLEILERLARAAEFRDDDTGEHTKRVGYVTGLVAAALGLSADEVELMERAATLHDIGKIGVSDTILLKPGPLTAEEFRVMREHTTIGARILSGSNVPVLQTAGDIAISHHERWDGTGYPEGRKGERIPLVGRIVAIADLFDALTHERPYKKAWTRAEALAEIEAQCGRQLDPGVVAAFMHVLNRVPEARA